MTMKPNIELHIDELVLHGFAPADRHAIGTAVEQALARLLTEGGVPARLTTSGTVSHLDGGAFEVGPRSSTDSIGAQVAQAVYGRLAQ
jgi:hypothetical protein